MGLGIGDAVKIKGAWDKFTKNHPKFPAFLAAAKAKGVVEGTVIGITITGPEGETLTTNVRVTNEDLDLFNTLSKG